MRSLPATENAGSAGRQRPTRRTMLTWGVAGAGGLLAAGGGALELAAHGVLPGQATLDRLDGACTVPAPQLRLDGTGSAVSGRFYSRARHRVVGYAIAWPPGHRRGSRLPLIIALHGFRGDHAHTLPGLAPQQALALAVGGRRLPPLAMVTVDGGNGYFHAHPGDDPMGMLVHEILPLCQGLGLGRPPSQVSALGISMGGYGALLMAEKHPHLIGAVAAISPAVWTSYGQARNADAGAYASAEEFASNDVITHASALAGKPVRVASGADDPFHPGVEALARALPRGAVVDFPKGCHTGSFFLSQLPASLRFLADH